MSKTIFWGFALLGLLIGFVAGISTAEITNPLITAILAFFGGKIFFDLGRNGNSDKQKGLILVAFCTFCITGLLTGICIKINRLLDFKEFNVEAISDTTLPRTSMLKEPYLKEGKVYDPLERLIRQGVVNCDSVCEYLTKRDQEQ